MTLLNPKNEQGRPQPFSLQREGKDVQVQMLADPYNSRLKLQSFTGDPLEVGRVLVQEAEARDFGKIIAYVREQQRSAFAEVMQEEGLIPGFFAGEDAYCMTAYPDSQRALPRDMTRAQKIIRLAHKKAGGKAKSAEGFTFRRAKAADVPAMAALYSEIFGTSYPTPLYDAGYLRQAMTSDTVFWLTHAGTKLSGAASLEIDRNNQNAEVTDCAVRNDYRGRGLLAALVSYLDEVARAEGVNCLYSLSRALLPGINVVLAGGGFTHYGRLINNCKICGGYEDMNIWQKFVNGEKDFLSR
jgi:putative beta-lysine N-acetyltransferase